MSTFIYRFSLPALLISMIFLLNDQTFSQDIFANIKIVSAANPVMKIEGKFNKQNSLIKNNWSFLKNYADAENLEKRINNFKIFDAEGIEIPLKIFADGEFAAKAKAESFTYQINLSVPENKSLMAHISWIDKNQGMLMLNDLFPQFGRENISAQIKFELPEDWRISTRAKDLGNREFQTDNLEKAIFLIGKDWREKEFTVKNTKINFVISGEWLFSDTEALEMARSILSEYDELFGGIPFEKTQIYLIRFPKEIETGRWRAETRGGDTVILSSSMPFKSQAIQRLHEQLRHELFHLWIPNALNLSGDYAWFYEGFAVYQALKTGVWLGQIRFEDFLNTISEASNIVNRVEQKFSLIEISKNRWRQASASVYSKGLLVAFLCDVAILENSKGKRDLREVFLEVYRKNNNSNIKKDANESILQVLNDFNELKFIVEKHIKGTEKIDPANYLISNGIENAGTSSNAKFKLKEKLNGREKAILKKLGYNRWREILRKSK
jgi:predicted metalloprotease with PDZ domain